MRGSLISFLIFASQTWTSSARQGVGWPQRVRAKVHIFFHVNPGPREACGIRLTPSMPMRVCILLNFPASFISGCLAHSPTGTFHVFSWTLMNPASSMRPRILSTVSIGFPDRANAGSRTSPHFANVESAGKVPSSQHTLAPASNCSIHPPGARFLVLC